MWLPKMQCFNSIPQVLELMKGKDISGKWSGRTIVGTLITYLSDLSLFLCYE